MVRYTNGREVCGRNRGRRAVALRCRWVGLTFVLAFLVFLLAGRSGAWAQATIQVSAPPNGTHFVTGEAPSVTATFIDDSGSPLLKDDLSTANLYVYGPQDPRNTTTSVDLLRAETDRNLRPHHYIDLLTHVDAVWDGNMVTYPLSPVNGELPGTYTATVWAVLAADSLQQWMPPVDFQVKTAVPETQLVEREKCAQCHLGASNGQYYLHHVDGRVGRPNGNRAIDSWPVRTCKSCHNQNGYAAFRFGGATGDANFDRIPDPIVHRIHGVHNGAHLESIRNEEVFADYLHVVFPADPRNCTYCHVDARWKTEPGQQACGACHDTVNFETGENHPGGIQLNDNVCYVCHPPEGDRFTGVIAPIATVHEIDLSTEHLVELSLSPANPYNAGDAPVLTIVVKEAATGAVVDPNTITKADWSRARLQVSGPRDGTVPVLTEAAADHSLSGSSSYIYNDLRVSTGTDTASEVINLGDTVNGNIPPAGTHKLSFDALKDTKITVKVRSEMGVNVTVDGPGSGPVAGLTASGSGANTISGVLPEYGRYNIMVASDTGGNYSITTSARAPSKITGTATAASPQTMNFHALAGSELKKIIIKKDKKTGGTLDMSGAVGELTAPDNSPILIDKQTAKENRLIATSAPLAQLGEYAFKFTPAGAGDYSYNIRWKNPRPVRVVHEVVGDVAPTADPRLTRSATEMTYQLDDVAGLKPGTYTVFVQVRKTSGRSGVAMINFEVGTDTEEPHVATNCSVCHDDTNMHGSYPFRLAPDICKNCHDYENQLPGRTDWLDRNWGFGAAPLSRRIHGVHFGRYLDKPEEIHGEEDAEHYGNIIFPQDVRNCVKCHSESDHWTEEPSRLACLACHDSDGAIAHGNLNTDDPTPLEPFSGDENESCEVCHGKDRNWEPSVVHNISDPYVPPYLRDPVDE